MSKLSFLDPSSDGSEPVSEPVVETAPEPQDAGQPRGPDGKFAPKEAAQAEVPPAAPVQPEPVVPEAPPQPVEPAIPSGHVPLAALLDTRDKASAAEAKAARLEEELRQFRAQNAPRPEPIDPEADPVAAYQEAQLQARELTLDWSKKLAVKEHGEETVNQAYQWAYARCDQDPIFNARVASSNDPYGLIMQEHQQNQLLAALQEPAKRERLLALLSEQAAPAAQAQQQAPTSVVSAPAPQSAPTPPRSIASAPSAGGAQVIPTGPGQAFDALFRKG